MLALVESGGYLTLGQAGVLAELAEAYVSAGILAEADADALQQALAGFVAVAGECGGLFGVDDDLGHENGLLRGIVG
jgi:hypothetical protein